MPDQSIAGCGSVTVRRGFGNDFERGLIVAAEHVPSSLGGEWWVPYYEDAVSSDAVGYDLRVPVAITSDAIRYYAERTHMFAAPESIPHRDIDPIAQFNYEADVVRIPAAAGSNGEDTFEVRMTLDYFESPGGYTAVLYLGIGPPGVATEATRTITFDQAGNLLSVAGDVEPGRIVVN